VSVFVRLRNKSGFFVDPDTGFSLGFDQEKRLPESLGKRTRDWLSGGGLIKFTKSGAETPNASPVSPVEVGENNQTQPTEKLQPDVEKVEDRFNGLSVSDLRKLCKTLGVTYSPKQDGPSLIKRILDFEEKAKQ
jgi:hypothetical protein